MASLLRKKFLTIVFPGDVIASSSRTLRFEVLADPKVKSEPMVRPKDLSAFKYGFVLFEFDMLITP